MPDCDPASSLQGLRIKSGVTREDAYYSVSGAGLKLNENEFHKNAWPGQ